MTAGSKGQHVTGRGDPGKHHFQHQFPISHNMLYLSEIQYWQVQ